MKIALVAHGRFYAFELIPPLLERGHDVTLFTSYPKWMASRFGVPPERTHSFWLHTFLHRAGWQLHGRHLLPNTDPWLHPLFGRWARRAVMRERWDAVHSWTGVSEELLAALAQRAPQTLRLPVRASSHIRVQTQLLQEEEQRSGVPQERAIPWHIDREEREYRLADQIVVLSSFAKQTFVEQGIPAERVGILPLGTSRDVFRPAREVIEARQRRILSGEPLRVLCVGTVSFRKGLWDLAEAVRHLSDTSMRFQFTGTILPEAQGIVEQLRSRVTFNGKVPQGDLPATYAWGDVFVFPTIEDGFAVVLAQAAAAGLPIIATTNCSAPDFVQHGESGWIVPIRRPDAIVERLRWADAHRQELAAMAGRVYERYEPRDWSDVAREFEQLCLAARETREAR